MLQLADEVVIGNAVENIKLAMEPREDDVQRTAKGSFYSHQ